MRTGVLAVGALHLSRARSSSASLLAEADLALARNRAVAGLQDQGLGLHHTVLDGEAAMKHWIGTIVD